MLARLGWAIKDNVLGRGDEERAYDAVKLVHAEDLHRWDRFPRCQDFDGITYGRYRAEAYQLERRRRTVAALIKARDELAELDTDKIVEYHSEAVEVPRRALLRRMVRVPLPQPPRPGTRVESSAGSIRGGAVQVEAGWRRRWIHLTYRGASRIVNAERIEQLRRLLDAMSEEQRSTIDEVLASRYSHPVLFISHRWESDVHPDPAGIQLQAAGVGGLLHYLRLLVIPSATPHRAGGGRFHDDPQLNGRPHQKRRRPRAPDYLTRGWCVYEYVVSSLRKSTVCDQVEDARFVELRDWASTPPPVAVATPFRDSFESQQRNFINLRILAAINEVLPIYREAEFQSDSDREVVTELLIAHLEQVLPAIKESQPYLGEWKTTSWTRERLAPFFFGEAELPALEASIPIRRFRSSVPSTLEDAVNRRYEIKRYHWANLLNPMDGLLRTDVMALLEPFAQVIRLFWSRRPTLRRGHPPSARPP